MSLRIAAVAVFLALRCAWPAVTEEKTAQQTTPPVQAVPAGYKLQSGDVIDVRFFYNPELNEQQVAIRPDGCISLQLIGDFHVAGYTPEQSRELLKTAYSHALRTPEVTIQVRNFAMNRIFVTGEVTHPGVINLSGPLSVLTALGEAGGATSKGNHRLCVLIRRGEDGGAIRMRVKLFEGGKPTAAAAAPLQPFDVVMVPEASVARVDRWVDEYIRQLSPANLVVGFQYLMQNQAAAPIF
jgi:protein involved in polysaccharide export with SLBB domain